MIKALSAIIEEAEKETTDAKQAKVLKDNKSSALKMIVGCLHDPLVRWLLPPGEPPYRPLPKSADVESSLYNQIKKLNYFISSEDGRKLSEMKREQIFIGLLESVDPDDARMLLRLKEGNINISKKAVKQAFPSISEGW